MSFKDLIIKRVEGEQAPALLKYYPLDKRGFIKVGQKKWFLPYRYLEVGDKIYNFEVRADDTWIITYPRSGTTMTQELIWLVANDMNFNEAHQRYLMRRFPFIEMEVMFDDHRLLKLIRNVPKNSVKFVQDQPSPRFIKSHLPLELLPTVVNSTCKIIYVARNPKDVAVSYYIFHKHILDFQGTFEQFCNNFLNDHILRTPYWEHVKEAWRMRHRANMMFVFYEDLIKDLPRNIKEIAAFFGKTYSDEQINKLVEHLKIENFRKNPMVNNQSPDQMKPNMFIRQGKTGSWKEIFTPEIEDRFDKWITDNLKDTDLTFPNLVC
ncbi:sulfotransferase 4A1-like [Monomorium pharaonis]|uniref:sulfotransferase 4A1-like n=1 Tax=Monomorium pharaonis TaxID=307658 RepID=UPI001746660F|nr:sulfotransferase 4A1-like [Monomorium pharaonis]XP_036150624.1 sulfotransferase 4A1-like [Monomorium pharaonis]